jgi:energy-coupling factor transport system ATP-binding protein
MISVQGLTYRFRASQRDALRDVNLTIGEGEFVVVTGPSGCGKSSLALAIGGYLFRQYDGEASGHVTVGGMDARRRPIYDLADVVGLVQQNPEQQFCTLTVQDEVAFGLENRRLPPSEIRERLAWALEIVGARHLADRALADLSGGEKQRVAVASVMAARPQVLILDEPTSSLDPTATAEVLRVIARLRERKAHQDEPPMAVVVIEHKVDYLSAYAPRWVAMDRGQIARDGSLLDRPLPESSASLHRSTRSRAPSGEPTVRVKDVSVDYGGPPVLREVSTEMRGGEFVALMGDNGSGKTTLLRCLMGLVKPNVGSVSVLGHDTRRTPVSELARQIGYVFQNPEHQLFCDSVWQEATFASRNVGALGPLSEAYIGRLLDRGGLGERREDHPYRLSYGEKRRLNLISVLGHGPRLILLDEPLIGQDAGNIAFLMGLLQERVADGATVVMVNHNPKVTRRYAGRLVFLSRGRVLVDAPTEEAFCRLAALGREAYLPASSNQVSSERPGCLEA